VGGFDVVVCAMVINCVPDARARAELLVRCRDHLAPGGLLYLSLPSRCLDVSTHVTRAAFETLLTALGFTLRDAKLTPKITLYALQRCDVVSYAPDAQPAPAGGPGGGGARARAPALAGAGGGPPRPAAEPVRLAPPPPPGTWRPRVVLAGVAEGAVVRARAADPPAPVPREELTPTGFSRTAFGVGVPEAWLEEAAAPPPPPPKKQKQKTSQRPTRRAARGGDGAPGDGAAAGAPKERGRDKAARHAARAAARKAARKVHSAAGAGGQRGGGNDGGVA